MARFETLLSIHVLALLGACTGSGSEDTTKEDTPSDVDTDTDTDTDTDSDTDADTDSDTDADTDTDTDSDSGYSSTENPVCADQYGTPSGYQPYGGGSGASGVYWYDMGYVAVKPGEACPDPVDVTTLGHTNCCPTPDYLATCTFVRKDTNQQADGYAGWVDAGSGSGGYGFGPVRDVCWYEGVFGPATDSACCGRPLLCDGEAVVADVTTRSDWRDRDAAGLPGDLAHRREAGLYWLRSAQLEHASVASFARFALELLRFGAPPELVDGAMQAGRDEVEHARLCFSLASSLLGQDVGPAPMPVEGAAQLADSRVAFAEALLREGCIGETLAVLDAAARLAVATDPAVRAALQTILDDEARHAALAWKAMAWVLEQDHDGAIRAHLEGVLAEAAPAPSAEADLEGLGLMTAAARDEAFRRGWEQVVQPTWAQLAA